MGIMPSMGRCARLDILSCRTFLALLCLMCHDLKLSAKPMPITTVIFDYGCVLSLPPGPADYEPLREAIGVEAAAFQELYWRNREAYDLDALDTTAYWQEIGRAAGVTFSPEQIQTLATLDCQLWGKPNPVMVEWVRVLRARGLKTAVLSNMSRNVGDYLRRTFPVA